MNTNAAGAAGTGPARNRQADIGRHRHGFRHGPDILVIGAGPSSGDGRRRRRGAFDHVERHDGVGGLWDIDTPTTPMYESAHFISSKRLSCFPGRPFDSGVADYPPRVEILRYLREFAAEEGLSDGIRFGVEVTGIARDGAGYAVTFAGAHRGRGWSLETGRGRGAANGDADVPPCHLRFRHPVRAYAQTSGDFDEITATMATYRSSDELRGKRPDHRRRQLRLRHRLRRGDRRCRGPEHAGVLVHSKHLFSW